MRRYNVVVSPFAAANIRDESSLERPLSRLHGLPDRSG